MLEYDRIDISEVIDVDKSSNKSTECDICHYWYFLDKNFTYQLHLSQPRHDLMQKAMSFKLLSPLKAVITEFIFGI